MRKIVSLLLFALVIFFNSVTWSQAIFIPFTTLAGTFSPSESEARNQSYNLHQDHPHPAGTFIAFGPETFVRGEGKPEHFSRSFSVLYPSTTYTIRVINGDDILEGEKEDKQERVRSATIKLNGQVIFDNNDLKKKISFLEKVISIYAANILEVILDGKPGSRLDIAITGIDNDPPTIMTSVDPPPNQAGWNNTDVTVTFTCLDMTSGIETCPTPVTVSTEGVNQVFSVTAVDRAENTAITNVILNIDKTDPNVEITSPVIGAILNTSNPTVTGMLSDGLSGISNATCNDNSAFLNTSNFICNVLLVNGVNLITVVARDLAGNSHSSIVSVNMTSSIDNILPSPEPNPCERLNFPCESALLGPYTIVSTLSVSGISTVVSADSGVVLSIDWLVAGNGFDLFVGINGFSPTEPSYYEYGLPGLREANVSAAAMLGFGQSQTEPFNRAGCDSIAGPLTCTRFGACCDEHDLCINFNCRGPNDSGDLRVCNRKLGELNNCKESCDDYPPLSKERYDCLEDCDQQHPLCSPKCQECHDKVVECYILSIFAPRGPSKCCAYTECLEDTCTEFPHCIDECQKDHLPSQCGAPQQCIYNGTVITDRSFCEEHLQCTYNGEIITDPCECKKHGIKPVFDQSFCPDIPGEGWGDVHLITFDRLAYDFQGVGEFVLARSLDDSLEIQTRMRPWRTSRVVSVNSAVVMNVIGDRVGIYIDRDPVLYINGVSTLLDGELTLPNGGYVSHSFDTYNITWPDGTLVEIHQDCSYLDIKIFLSESRRGRVEGLLGNFNGDQADDLVTQDGVVLDHSPSLAELYQQYGESWRIVQEESLFDYLEGTTTETYTDRTFPGSFVSTTILSDSQRQEAEQICRDAGVTDPVILEACILDVGITGDRCFSEFPVSVTPPQDSVTTEGPVSSGPIRWDLTDGGNGHLYEAILVPGGISWTDANTAAQAKGGGWHLATITSADENAFVFSLVGDNSAFWNCCLSGNSEGPWLGGYKVGPGGGDYAWVTDEPFSYTNWGPLEPFGNGDRIGLFGYQGAPSSSWNDVPASMLEFGYIIEKSEEMPRRPISEISFTDQNLALCVIALGLTYADEVTALACNAFNINELSGIEALTNLTSLELNRNNISNLNPISLLTKLTMLDVSANNVSEVSALASLINLINLFLNDNDIGDVSALVPLVNLNFLDLRNNGITSGVTELDTLVNATSINLFGNNNIPCADLESLVNALGSGVVILPSFCI